MSLRLKSCLCFFFFSFACGREDKNINVSKSQRMQRQSPEGVAYVFCCLEAFSLFNKTHCTHVKDVFLFGQQKGFAHP